MNRRLGWRIEKYILLTIIALSLLNFFGLASVFIGYVLDIIAWSSIAYIIYVISPTELFFGERHAHIDLATVLAYVIMGVKDLIGNAIATLPQLIAAAPSYVKFEAANVTTGVPFPITTADLNAYTLFHAIPRSADIATSLAPHFTMANQTLNVILLESGKQAVSLVATPTTTNGAMLMFYNTLVQNSATIQMASLMLGMTILIVVSIFAAYLIPVRRPSILAVLKEEGKPGFLRAVWVFLLLVGFFVIVFNLLFEWMTITNDSPLLIVGLLVVGTLFIMHRLGVGKDEVIEEIGNMGDSFYKRVLRLFMDSKTILLVISGFLVMHLLTDVGNFIAPALFNWYQTLYLVHAAGDHTPLVSMIASSLHGSVGDAGIVLAYALSTCGLALLLALPAFIWYKMFRLRETGSHEHLPDWEAWHVGIVMACIAVFIIVPVFSFSSITTGDLVGVNLTTAPITADREPLVLIALLAGAAVFVACLIIGALSDRSRRFLMLGPFLTAVFFFGVYVYNYFVSSFLYYSGILVSAAREGLYGVMPIMFIMFAFSIIFFITGFFAFLYEIWRD